jgi:hypothetical protein
MKKTQAVLLSLFLASCLFSASSSAEDRHPQAPAAGNPITVEGQIQDITRDGDAYVLRLFRQKYVFVAYPSTYVRIKDGDRIDIAELRPEDSVHLAGDLDHDVVYSHRIIVLGRIEHRP